MRVKRYVVNALPDALPMIRSELGKDAVILNTKEIYIGGFLGMFRKKKMEVIAAVETGVQTSKPQPAKPKASAPAAAKPMESDFVRQLQQAQAAQAAVPPAAVSSAYGAAAYAEADGRKATAVAESVRTAAPEAKQPVVQDDVMQEIRQMKELVVKLSKQRLGPAVPEGFASLQERLAGQEVSQKLIDKLLQLIEEDAAYKEMPDEPTVWKLAETILAEWMAPFAAKGIAKSDRIVHFVGPTGVGKTTTIAKLAAEQTLKQHRKVGFITSDTYRIAAVDQLRTYANILNVPLEVVFSPAELLRAFKQLGERDLIFMDTAGRNFRNELYVSEVNSLLQSDDSSETYLVLSLTGKTKDMDVVAERFSKFGIKKAIFTKFDETDTFGAVLNLAMEHGITTAYIACGQNVPDDIQPFRIHIYVKQLLGAEAHD
jgi:flagellar biosynthesis protein FlhF